LVFINDVTTIHGNKGGIWEVLEKFAKKERKQSTNCDGQSLCCSKARAINASRKVWLSGPSGGNAFAPMSLICFKNLLSFVRELD